MFDRLNLQRIWNRCHHEKPVSGQSEGNIVAFAEYIQKQLPKQASLLDAGCGRGRNAIYLSRVGFSVCGCDVSPVALEMAKKRTQQENLRINFQVSDLTSLPYADHSFAAAICVHVLPYHLKADIAEGMRELWRVLQPAGWLYADFLDREDADYGCGQKLEEHTFLDPDGVPIHFSSRREIDALMNGFVVERATRSELQSPADRIRVSWTIWAVKSA